jgi:hypothetical protein
VEQDKAPDVLIAGKSDHGKLVMTRPLYPFPQTARYIGHGDPSNAENFASQPAAAR